MWSLLTAVAHMRGLRDGCGALEEGQVQGLFRRKNEQWDRELPYWVQIPVLLCVHHVNLNKGLDSPASVSLAIKSGY